MGTLDIKEGDCTMTDVGSEQNLDEQAETILNGGVIVKSYEGTSQYTHRGISACGLASFNAVRCMMDIESSGVRGGSLVKEILSKQLVDVSSISFKFDPTDAISSPV